MKLIPNAISFFTILGFCFLNEECFAQLDISNSYSYDQTSEGVEGTFLGVYGNIDYSTIYSANSVTVQIPGQTSPQTFLGSGTNWYYYTANALPDGTYTVASDVYPYSVSDDFEINQPPVPIFTGNSLQALEDDNPSDPITVTFNGFTLGQAEDQAQLALGVINDGTHTSSFFNPASDVTSYTFAANTFAPGSEYTVELIYVDGAIPLYYGASENSSTSIANFNFVEGDNTFAPEPSSWMLVLSGVGLLSIWRLRRFLP